VSGSFFDLPFEEPGRLDDPRLRPPRPLAPANRIRVLVADDSVVHHALRGDFSRWAVGAVQDRALGSLLAGVENECAAKITIAANGVRQRVETAVAQRYGLDDGAAIATPQ